ncbi:sll0787 family AIR synthase-like protein [Caballeronia sp. LZ062]|uniref:sll0787 family AIR synthase-like protein n=1 Tax=unclassified Caballeronia TaxID=2646786 RepID=UPI00285A3432|nr:MULTISPECIES: sll0787 family AIR synthase-like protein [unclassified Caballeronia]MDR5857767.1 sll0787 family AIR synthase-like protein [Caballeronia sp. LZ050]MDR5869317.1 sll0787 family AIR synthase-like protein [Caballeronia sp. LZ062]
MSALQGIVERLRESRGFRHKRDISGVLSRLPHPAVAIGDDCAAIPDGDGYLLFAIEGMVSDFVRAMPWFAGYSSVMVNVSDIYAMGGRPIAIVDALWSGSAEEAHDVLAGMAAASKVYDVPIVGGHTNVRSDGAQLAVSIVGRARKLLTSFVARPGDALIMAVDLRGKYEDPYPFWNASVSAPDGRARGDFELLPALAEAGLCDAAKDISMGGVLGTALMLLECSKAGARIDLDAVPRPDDADFERWLNAFPSFGFVLSVRREHVDAVLARFASRSLACAVIGQVDASHEVVVTRAHESALLWNLREEPFICAR